QSATSVEATTNPSKTSSPESVSRPLDTHVARQTREIFFVPGQDNVRAGFDGRQCVCVVIDSRSLNTESLRLVQRVQCFRPVQFNERNFPDKGPQPNRGIFGLE